MTDVPAIDRLPLTPYGIQLADIFVQRIRAERSPQPTANTHPAVDFTVREVYAEQGRAGLLLEVQCGAAPDEIFVALVAHFRYTSDFTDEQVCGLLQHRMLNILMPYARELVHHLCIRMSIAPLILTMVAVDKQEEVTRQIAAGEMKKGGFAREEEGE